MTRRYPPPQKKERGKNKSLRGEREKRSNGNKVKK